MLALEALWEGASRNRIVLFALTLCENSASRKRSFLRLVTLLVGNTEIIEVSLS